MPKFQIYQQQSIEGGRRATAEDFGAGTGLAKIGQALGQTAEALSQYKQKKDADWMSVKMSETRAWAAETMANESANAEEGGEGFRENFKETYKTKKAEILEGAPGAVRRTMEAALNEFGLNLDLKAMDFESQAAAAKVVSDFQNIVDLSSNTALIDPTELDQSVKDAHLFIDNQQNMNADQKKKLKEFASEKITRSAIKGMDPEDALDGLRGGDYDALLDPKEKEALINAKVRELNALNVQARKEDEAARGVMLSDLSIAVSRGEQTYSDIEEAYKGGKGWLKSAERTRLTLKLDEKTKKERVKADQIASVNFAIENGLRLDPKKGGDDRKAMNAHFDSVVPSFGDDPEEVMNQSIDYAIDMGMVPDKLQSSIRGNIRGGTPEQKVLASGMLEKMRKGNYQLLNDFSKEDIAEGVMIAQFSGYGMDAVKAVKMVEEAKAVPESTRIARGVIYEEYIDDEPSADWLEDNSDVYDEDEINPAMIEEFNKTAREIHTIYGETEGARMAAMDIINKVWGPSEINGESTTMRYPPEKFYGLSGLSTAENAEWMHEQLVSDIRSGGMIAEGFEDNITIQETVNTKNGLPVYTIMIMNIDGVPRPLRESVDGPQIEWAPDWSTSAEKARQDKKTKDRIAGDMQARDDRLSPTSQLIDDINLGYR